MKPKELAALLHGMDLNDFPRDLMREAKRYGLVVVIGTSDSSIETYGAIQDEADLPEGGTLYFDADGVLPDVEDVTPDDERAYYDRKKMAASIDANWRQDGFVWTFSAAFPHSRFLVVKDGTRYCRGIVFDLASAGLSG